MVPTRRARRTDPPRPAQAPRLRSHLARWCRPAAPGASAALAIALSPMVPTRRARRKRRACDRGRRLIARFLLAPQTARIVTGRRLIARFLLAPQTARIVTGRRLIARFLLAPQTPAAPGSAALAIATGPNKWRPAAPGSAALAIATGPNKWRPAAPGSAALAIATGRASSDCPVPPRAANARIVTGRRLIARFLLAPQTRASSPGVV